jgi:hypothetical protein
MMNERTMDVLKSKIPIVRGSLRRRYGSRTSIKMSVCRHAAGPDYY